MKLPALAARPYARKSGKFRSWLKPNPDRGTDQWEKGLIEWVADWNRAEAYSLARPWWWPL